MLPSNGAGGKIVKLAVRDNQAVLDAVRDVAQNGSEVDDLDRRVHLQNDRIEALRVERNSADASYRTGLEDKLAAMQAQTPLIEARLELVQLIRDEIETGIALTKALGGGYHSDDLPADPAGRNVE